MIFISFEIRTSNAEVTYRLWSHRAMETLSMLLAFCEGNPPVHQFP